MNEPTNPPTLPKKKRGCFFYGCITTLVIALIMVISIFFAARYGIRKVNEMIAEYTDTQPAVLPKDSMPSTELDELKARCQAFRTALDAHSNTPPLVLTGREINALLNADAGQRLSKSQFYVTIDGSQIKGEVSLALDDVFTNRVRFIDINGRYLNGEATFNAGLSNQQVFANIDSLAVKGKPIPDQYLAAFRTNNLLQSWSQNPTNAADIARFKSIDVHDGEIVITPAGGQ